MQDFTPLSAALGGALIGLSAALLLALNGRIAGVSGITGALLPPRRGDVLWRVLFLAGLIVGAWLFVAAGGSTAGYRSEVPLMLVAVAGVLVGFGTRLGSGCTSGHGICGMARFSPRSLVAVAVFMLSAMLTVFVVRHLLGGGA